MDTTTLLLAGDVMTGRGIDQVMPEPLPPVLYEQWVHDAREYVRLAEKINGVIATTVSMAYIWGDALAEMDRLAPDARIVNLETAVTHAATPWPGKGIHYRMNPAHVGCLAAARIDACSLANNHVLDWGVEGLDETLATLHAAGVLTAGAGTDARQAQAPAVLALPGGARLLLFALATPTCGVPPDWGAQARRSGIALLPRLDEDAAQGLADRVRHERRAGDLVVLSLHWGENWVDEIPAVHHWFAHRLIDLGAADVVHGHSSHHPLAIEVYQGKPVLYGCGDLINDYEGIEPHGRQRSDLGCLYSVTLDRAKGRLARLEIVPLQLRRFRLTHPQPAVRQWLHRLLDHECRAMGTPSKPVQRGTGACAGTERQRRVARSADAMLADTHALGLSALPRHLGDELHLGAELQMLERHARDIVGTEVVLVAVRRADEAALPLVAEADHLAMKECRVQLLLSSRPPHRVLDLPLHVIEGFPQGDIDVFVVHAVDAELVVGQSDVDAHGEGPSLMPMLVRLLDADPAGHDVPAKPVELLTFLACGGLDRVGRPHAEETDLQRLLHGITFSGCAARIPDVCASQIPTVGGPRCRALTERNRMRVLIRRNAYAGSAAPRGIDGDAALAQEQELPSQHAHTVRMRHFRHRTPSHVPLSTLASAGLAPGDKASFWSRDAAGLLAELNSGVQGLSSAEARRRLHTEGFNTLDEEVDMGVVRLFLGQFKSPLVLILVFGGVVSATLRDWLDATIIVVVVLGSCGLGFLQEYRASKAVAQLRKRLALTVNVLRDGAQSVLPTRELVPGDVVSLSAGNLVPADGLVLEARDFLVTEASLTGESLPVEKQPGVLRADTPIARRTNAVYLGTSVRSGTATVVVVHTGEHTAFGAVAQQLRAAPPETEFARGVQQFGVLLVRVMVVMVLFVLIVNQWMGRPWIESMLFAVALAVGLSPELLPAIVSVTLSAGARRMAQRGVIVRHLEAIENLGSMDFLCTDKTGTLTEGVMTLEAATAADGTASTDVLRLAYLNAAFETGIDNPLDAALVAAGTEAGLTTAGLRKIDEIPYDFLRKRLTIAIAPDTGGPHLIITKGAFANVLATCTRVAREGGSVPLDDAQRVRLDAWFREQGTRGFRLLGLTTREVEPRSSYTHGDEAGMCFAGFLLFLDPPKATVRHTLEALAARGVGIKIVTGDNRYVAAHVAESVGLDARAMLTGEEIDVMKQKALWHRAEKTVLFVEVDPQQKERIVRALQHRGHAVGYLGDGINDAPSLHAADVGISVDDAVDVARESADVVLLRPDLEVLCQGVEEGRRTFANTLKYISITTSANFGNMISMALAAPLLPFLPLAAKQILLNNFLSDLPSIAISSDRVDDDRLARAQHWDVRDLRRYMLVFGLTSSLFDLLTFWLLLKVFHASAPLFQTSWFVVSLLTELAVLLVLRTHLPVWGSRPGTLLWMTTVVVAAIALAPPFIDPVAALFGLVALSPALLGSMLLVVLGYVAATEFAKRRFYARPPRRMRAPLRRPRPRLKRKK
jgi:Mg2+-importing ATPase